MYLRLGKSVFKNSDTTVSKIAKITRNTSYRIDILGKFPEAASNPLEQNHGNATGYTSSSSIVIQIRYNAMLLVYTSHVFPGMRSGKCNMGLRITQDTGAGGETSADRMTPWQM